MLPGHEDPSGGGSRLYNNLIPQPIVSCLVGGPSVMFPSDAGLWMPTLLGRASGLKTVKPVKASMPGKDSSFLFPGAKLIRDLTRGFLFCNFWLLVVGFQFGVGVVVGCQSHAEAQRARRVYLCQTRMSVVVC